MKNYSVFHPLYLSFFSKSLYQDVAKNWKGTGLAYLLLLLALAWVPGWSRSITAFPVKSPGKPRPS